MNDRTTARTADDHPDDIHATGEPLPRKNAEAALMAPREPEPGMPLTGLTKHQAAVALRRLGYSDPARVSLILHLAAENGQHLTSGHLVSFHGHDQDGGYGILPASQVTHYASAADEHEAAWLRAIRDIAVSQMTTDAEVGGRVRALLYPQHIHDDDGTVEGCPGCFPPGEVIGAGRLPVPARPDGHELLDMLIAKHGVDRFPAAPSSFRHLADELGELGEALMLLYLAKAGDSASVVDEDRAHVRKELGDVGLSLYGLAGKLGENLDEAMSAVVRDDRRSFASSSGEEIARGCANC